jgi:hypothetical protein
VNPQKASPPESRKPKAESHSLSAGRSRGLGSKFLTADLSVDQNSVSPYLATLVVRWGDRGGDREPEVERGRNQYSRTGPDAVSAVERVREAALDDQHGESVRYVEQVCSEMLIELTKGLKE